MKQRILNTSFIISILSTCQTDNNLDVLGEIKYININASSFYFFLIWLKHLNDMRDSDFISIARHALEIPVRMCAKSEFESLIHILLTV